MKAIALMSCFLALPVFGQTVVDLWEGDMPGAACTDPEGISPNTKNGVVRIINVSRPTLTYYPAPHGDAPRPLVIVCPGGGYNILAINLEGIEIAEWLNSIGVSAAVLKYRVPKNREGALQDARRAVRLARDRSEEWNIDSARVGMLGFSAGGHLTAACSNSPDRPNFSVLVYPAYLYKNGGIQLADEIDLDPHTPPAFVVQTRDDTRHYRSSLAYSTALDAAGIPVELHLFAKGGHGYGLRPSEHPVSKWPQLCEAWMREMGILAPIPKAAKAELD